MNRDHFLFLLIGALCGFIAGYVAHETMAARQPAPLWGGTVNAGTAQPGAPQPGGPQPGAAQRGPGQQGPQPGAPAGPQAAMAEVQRLRAYVAENPTDYDAVRTLGNLNYDIANWGRAAELYEQYLSGRPDDADVMTDLGACYRNLGRLDDALGIFARIRELAPSHWQAHYNEILVIAFDKGDPEAALPVLEELEALQPGNADVVRLATEVRRRLGR